MKVLFLMLLSFTGVAQTSTVINIAKNCSESDLKTNLYYLASPELKGRLMASNGDSLASSYVANWFTKNGVQAPYKKGKSYYQTVEATQQVGVVTLAINDKKYAEFDGWQLFPKIPLNLKKIPVLFTDYSDADSLLMDLPKMNVKGKAIIFTDRAYGKMLNSNIDSVEAILITHGVKLIIWASPTLGKYLAKRKSQNFIPEYVQNKVFDEDFSTYIPELGMTLERLREILENSNIKVTDDGGFSNPNKTHFYDLESTLDVQLKRTFKTVKAPNIIGVIQGLDTSLPCVVVSAHHDHDGSNGKDIYYGAVDNASGTATIMQLATMINEAVGKGLRPKRTIVFASFTGEERGLLGSFYYVNHPLVSPQKTYANINLDMLGRVDSFYSGKKADSNYVYIIVKDSANKGLRENLIKANNALTNLKLDSYYENPQREKRRLTGSDQYPFYLKGIPVIRIDCGFSKDYHQLTDTPDKINYPLLKQQTQLCFLTLWNLANN